MATQNRHPLHEAASVGDVKDLKEVLKDLEDKELINATDNEGRSALHIAASAFVPTNMEIVNCLLNKGADVNLKDNRSWTPLHYAASYQLVNLTKLLLRSGADAKLTTEDGVNVLHLLARIPCDIKSAPTTSKELMEGLQLAISKGGDINGADSRGTTPLHEAATKGNKKIISFLIKNGADMTARDGKGDTALDIAALFGNKSAAKLFVSLGGDKQVLRKVNKTKHSLGIRKGRSGSMLAKSGGGSGEKGKGSNVESPRSNPDLKSSGHRRGSDKDKGKDKDNDKDKEGKDKGKEGSGNEDFDQLSKGEPEDIKTKEVIYINTFADLPSDIQEMALKEGYSVELLNQHIDVLVSILRFLVRKNYRLKKKKNRTKADGTSSPTAPLGTSSNSAKQLVATPRDSSPAASPADPNLESIASDQKDGESATDQTPLAIVEQFSPSKIAEDHDPEYYEDSAQLLTNEPPTKTYKIIEKAGKGGFGSVYQAKVLKKKERVAVKIMGHTTEKEKRFNFNEIHFLSKCSHPNIVKYLSSYINQGKSRPEIWVVMEFMEGGTLKQVVQRNLKENQIAYVSKEILKGLKFLHEQNFVHRDLKSNNIMLSVEGDVKLIDFGLCIDISKGQSNRMVGSPFWVSPEMIRRQPHGCPADIWSFGICILEMTNGNPPHRKSPLRCLFNYGIGEVPGPDRPDQWSSDFKDFLSQCLKADPSERATADQLLQHAWLSKAETRKSMRHILQSIFIEKALQTTLGLG